MQATISAMHLNPWRLLVIAMAGWMNREQSAVVEYLKEENRVLRELLGNKRLRLNDDQKRRYPALYLVLMSLTFVFGSLLQAQAVDPVLRNAS